MDTALRHETYPEGAGPYGEVVFATSNTVSAFVSISGRRDSGHPRPGGRRARRDDRLVPLTTSTRTICIPTQALSYADTGPDSLSPTLELPTNGDLIPRAIAWIPAHGGTHSRSELACPAGPEVPRPDSDTGIFYQKSTVHPREAATEPRRSTLGIHAG